MVNGTLKIEDYLVKCHNGLFEVDRSKFCKCAIPSRYEIVAESPPMLVLRSKALKDKFTVADCGKLFLKVIEKT